MKFDQNLAAIHGYLCGDGYVIRNPPPQKHKYYHIGLRNTDKVLLEDFQKRFTEYFRIKPIITKGRCKVQNKKIYTLLTEEYSYYSYEWKLPDLSLENLKEWLRAFFDCEGWVENYPGKSRLIGLDCCNEKGLRSIRDALCTLGIFSVVKRKANRNIWRLKIFGLENLRKFQQEINFVHPEKNKKLGEAINSYQNLIWQIPKNKEEILTFVKSKSKARKDRGILRLISVKEKNLLLLQKALKNCNIQSKLLGPWKSRTCSQYYCLEIKEKEIYGTNTSRSSARTEAS